MVSRISISFAYDILNGRYGCVLAFFLLGSFVESDLVFPLGICRLSLLQMTASFLSLIDMGFGLLS